MNSLTFKPALAAALAAAAVTGATLTAHAATSGTLPDVIAFDQKVQNSQISIDYAYMPAQGYAVVYGADKDGNPTSEPLGYTELGPGDHRGVKVKLNAEPKTGSKLWVSLYKDKDQQQGFKRGADASFWTERLPLENSIVVR